MVGSRASQRTCLKKTNENLPHTFMKEEDRPTVCCLSDGIVFQISQSFIKNSEELKVYRSSNSGVQTDLVLICTQRWLAVTTLSINHWFKPELQSWVSNKGTLCATTSAFFINILASLVWSHVSSGVPSTMFGGCAVLSVLWDTTVHVIE